jgi:3-hydroxybutyryl-CoA dehydratase
MFVGLHSGFSRQLTADDVDRFASLSGDENPLHVDADYARKAGFPGRVVYGMLTSSLYSRLVGMYLPGELCLLQGIQIDMVAPAFVGDTVTVEGEVVHLSEAFRRIELRARVTRDDGQVISKAKIRVGLRDAG